ncbi:hypothetical protein ATK23_0039 [Glutamicibacter mysorens]|uniref:Uncharacterized protein n=1 Tax=Glutamicibacter mysorens TaxID=257984 RepID=A0ABX4MZ11_9MICC|nr:hypothetical protein [Glutamicibacter mysorens]PJJ42882.1 hypothetical protein ATK23_0039 [Glutamicibacter mysorens]
MAIPILPIIDRQTGQVQFTAEGRWCTRYVAHPLQLERLIARCSRRPAFDPDTSELLLVVPAAGNPAGRRYAFSLAKFPSPGALAKVES